MFRGNSTLLSYAAATVAAIVAALVVQPAWAQSAQDGVELQTRGPVHEAFADVVATTPTDGFVVPKQPPEPVNEVPPDVKPEGDVVWIPGYWAWDDERNDFLWVSGVWRLPPPNATWVPGYWAEANGGFEWVSGFWTAEQQLQYYPEPPLSLEQGPASPQPGDDFFYVPGQWLVVNGQYAWQPGYWARYQQGWVWSNSRYVRTPSGYVYVAGGWDYPFQQRGVMFAPAYFSGGVYSRPGFAYRPSLALNVALLASMLFARPNYGSYYFGDYYGNNYLQAGYQPWYASRNTGFYNNLYGYERWSRRGNDPDWDNRIRGDFDRRFADESARPPRDWQRWQERNRDGDNTPNAVAAAGANQNTSLFVSLDQASKQNFGGRRWESIQPDTRDRFEKMSQQVRQLTDQRRKTELEGRGKGNFAGARPGGPNAGGPNAGVAGADRPSTDGRSAEARPLSQFRLPQGPQSRVTAKPIDGRDGDTPRVPNAQGADAAPSASQVPKTAQGPGPGQPPAVRRSELPDAPELPRTPNGLTPNGSRTSPGRRPDVPRAPNVQPMPNVPQTPNVPNVPNTNRPEVPRGPQGVNPRSDDRPQGGRPAGVPGGPGALGGNPNRGNAPMPTAQPNSQPRIQVPQPGNNPGQPAQPRINIPQRSNDGGPKGPPEARGPRGNDGGPKGPSQFRGNDGPKPSGPPQGSGGGGGDKSGKGGGKGGKKD